MYMYSFYIQLPKDAKEMHWEKKIAKMNLLKSNFENWLSFVEESRFFFILIFGEKWSSKESWGEPYWLFFFLSVCEELQAANEGKPDIVKLLPHP